jgi:predicted ATP-binding protein involved in virulence
MKSKSNYSHKSNDTIDLYLSNLVQEKLKLAEESKYVEADNLKRKIKDVKQKIEINNKKAVEEQHETERITLENNFQKEADEHEANWNRKFEEFRKVEKNEVEALILNQNKALLIIYK